MEKVRLQDVSPKFGQISTPMSITKNIKHRESTAGYMKNDFINIVMNSSQRSEKMLSRDLLIVSLNYVGRDSNHVQTGLFLL